MTEPPARTKREAGLIDQWKRKVIHGIYPHEINTETVDKPASLMWFTDGFLYSETERSFIAIQDGVVKR